MESPSSASAPALADVIAQIREEHRQRQDYHSAEKRLTNQIKAIHRRMLGGRATSDTLCAGAAEVEEGGAPADHPATPGRLSPDPALQAAANLATVHLEEARASLHPHRLRHESRMAALVKLLPVWPWVQAIRGAGALGLAQLVGECGDIGSYRSPAGLWKRLGVAVMTWCDDCGARIDKGRLAICPSCAGGTIRHERQRRIAGAAALVHGYDPERRSILWNIGESLVKQNRDGDAPGHYRQVYLDRKAYEAARPPCLHKSASGYVCKNADGTACSKGHVHARAGRYMQKRYVRDLWHAWRAAK